MSPQNLTETPDTPVAPHFLIQSSPDSPSLTPPCYTIVKQKLLIKEYNHLQMVYKHGNSAEY